MLKVQLKKPIKFALGRPEVSEVTIPSMTMQVVEKEIVRKDEDGNEVRTKKKVTMLSWGVGEGAMPGHALYCSVELPADLAKELFELATKATQEKIEEASA